MKLLFKKIDGNTFKLNETVKEFSSIIKETIQSDDSLYRVSKIDEDFALNYIRRKLIPENVREFNSDVTFQNGRGITDLRKITTEEVSRKLVKVLDIRRAGEHTDHIAYTAHIYDSEKVGPIHFKYDIYRDNNDGHLTVKYWYTFARYAFMVDLSNPQKLKENAESEWWHITKEEEGRALQYIRRRFPTEHGAELGKKIKKLKHELYPNKSDELVFGGYVNGEWMGFRVKKDNKGIWVGQIYDSGQKKTDAWFNVPAIPIDPNLPWAHHIDEGIGEYEISKREEEEAFQFMKRQVIPQLVSNYNFGVNHRASLSKYMIYKPTTEKEIIQNLKKVSHRKYDEQGNFYGSDHITYRSTLEGGNGPTFDFYIDKTNGVLYASYDTPFQSHKISYRVGTNYR